MTLTKNYPRFKLVQVIPDLGTGGAENTLLILSDELRRRGHDLKVISLWPPTGTAVQSSLQRAGVETIFLEKRPGVDLRVFARLAKALNLLEPHIVHTHRMAVRYVLPWLLRNPGAAVAHTVHTLAEQEGTRFDRAILGRVYRSDRIRPIACGPSVADSFETEFGFRPATIQNGIPIPEFCDTGPEVDVCETRSGPLRIIMIARFQPVKNHALLIEGLAGLAARGIEFKVELVGDGPLRADVETQVRNRGLATQVNFVGEVSDVGAYLQSADVMVLTSRYEGSPLAVMEAMSYGVPVVAPSVGGLPDLLREGGGWLYEPGNHLALARRLTELAGAPDELLKAGARGRAAAVARFGQVAMANGYLEQYSSMVTRGIL